MPAFRRRKTYRSRPKRTFRRKTYGRKRVQRMRIQSNVLAIKELVNVSTTMNRFQTAVSAGTMTQNSSGFMIWLSSAAQSVQYASVAVSYQMADCPNATTYFTPSFDKYRIKKVKNYFMPIVGQQTSQKAQYVTGVVQNADPENPGLAALLHMAADFDDDTALPASDAGIDSLRRRKDYKCINITNLNNRVITKTIYPKPAAAAYGGTFNQYMQMKSGLWFDNQSTGARLYGLKFIIELFNPIPKGSYIPIKWTAKYDLEFRDPV